MVDIGCRRVFLKLPVLILCITGIFVLLRVNVAEYFQKSFTPDSKAKKFSKKHRDIVFIRTSGEELEWFELCAFYSAAKLNPKSRVKLLTTKTFKFPKFLSSRPNFKQVLIDLSEIFDSTPLEDWFKQGKWRVPEFVKRVRFLSDALRLAYLYKNGGLYMDTDSITLKNLENLPDGLAYQGNISSGMWLANGFLSFEKPRHQFLNMVLTAHKKSFNPKKREFNFGPELVTKTYRTYENLRKTRHNNWPNVSAFPQEMVYPVAVSKFKSLFRPAALQSDLEKVLWDALTVHLWRNQVRKIMKNPHLVPPEDTLLFLVAKRQCPEALKMAKKVT